MGPNQCDWHSSLLAPATYSTKTSSCIWPSWSSRSKQSWVPLTKWRLHIEALVTNVQLEAATSPLEQSSGPSSASTLFYTFGPTLLLYVSRLETGFAFAKAMRIKKVFVGKNLIYKRRKIEKSKLSKAHLLFSKSHKRRKIYATKRSERREHKELTYKVQA